MRLNAVNGILSSFPYGWGDATNDGAPIVFKLLYRLWAADPDRRDARHREDQARLRQQQLTEQHEREQREETDELLTVVIVSEEIRRACEELQRDIEDAIRATRIAYDRAVREQEAAREALESAQRNALVLSDGRRAYFAVDGNLYGEDRNEITDSSAVAEARRLLRSDSTSYETYLERWDSFTEADVRVHQIATALDRLDDLEQKAAAGLASEDEVAEVRSQLDHLLADLPAEARQEYDHIHEQQKTAPTPASDNGPVAVPIPALPEVTTEDLDSAEVASPKPTDLLTPKP